MKKILTILPYIAWYSLIGIVVYLLDHYCHRITDRFFWFREGIATEKVLLIAVAFLSFQYGDRLLRFFIRWYHAARFIRKHNIN